MRTRGLIALTTFFAAACVATTDKGEEDDIPDGKGDSFGSPTSHGSLRFGVANRAEFTDADGFHAWTFSLTATAMVELTTELGAPNLDTVLYLYKKRSNGSWGDAVHRNDDASSDTAASKLDVSLAKGDYRVLVKAYKRTQRGEFAVNGECTGAGCPVATVCAAPEAIPSATDYGAGCGDRIAAQFKTGRVASQTNSDATKTERCSLDEIDRRAFDYYESYGFVPEADTVVAIERRALDGGGFIVTLSDGGDESVMTFLFDASRELVAGYQYNQSPDVLFYCRTSGPVVAVPGMEECMSSLLRDIPHAADHETAVSLTSATNSLPAGLGAEVRGPLLRYAQSRGLPAATPLTASGKRWTGWASDLQTSRLEIRASGQPITSYLSNREMILLEAPSDGKAALVCAAP